MRNGGESVHEVSQNYLIGEDADVFVERLGRADVAAGYPRLPRRTRRQLTLLKDERQQREQRMPATSIHHHPIDHHSINQQISRVA